IMQELIPAVESRFRVIREPWARNWFELVQGDRSRSGGQWDIWEATYSPAGPDGYPMPIWNKKTGVIDKKVADYWKQHFDLRNIVETNWATLGPKLANKINIYVGDADT